MPIDVNALSRLAVDYTQRMTSIRGRRVQRLIQREFAGADHVLIVEVASRGCAVLGLSSSGAGLCATDGRGPHASVSKWLHGSAEAVEVRFDLLKDSLPVVDVRTMPLSSLLTRADVHLPAGSVPPAARRLASAALRAFD